MSNRTFVPTDSAQCHYRTDRRRWVPKGVALLAVLFVVGLLSACHGDVDSLVAEIAVPLEQEVSPNEACYVQNTYSHVMITSRNVYTEARSNLNVL